MSKFIKLTKFSDGLTVLVCVSAVRAFHQAKIGGRDLKLIAHSLKLNGLIRTQKGVAFGFPRRQMRY